MITIKKVTLRKAILELKEPFAISSGTITHRELFYLECEDESGITVWSELTAQNMPNYNPETIDAAWSILSDWILPKVISKTFEHPKDIFDHIALTVRGNHMARAAVEMAAWAIMAHKQDTSLAALLGGTQKTIPTGISIGIQDSPEALVERVGRALKDGYKKIKVKIKPGADIDYITALRQAYPDAPIMVDANNSYTLDDMEIIKALDQFELIMIEQPLAWDDIIDHAQVQPHLKTPVCLDESITGLQQTRQALQLKSCKIINIKPGRVGGLSEAMAIHDYCAERHIPVWCGGMVESGIGRAYNVALASCPNFTIPGDLSPSNRYWKEDVVTPEWTMDESGLMEVPFDKPGIGVKIEKERIDDITLRKKVIEA